MSTPSTPSTQSFSDIEAVLFDADGTLLTFNGSPALHYAAVLREHGCTVDEQEIETAFRAVWKERADVYLNREHSFVTDTEREYQFWQQFVAAVCDTAGCQNVPEAVFEAIYELFSRSEVRPLRSGMQELVEMLAARTKIGVLSNHDVRVKKVLGRSPIGQRISFILTAEEVGYKKPASALFVAAAHAFRVPVDRLLYVGNDYECDYRGARAAGMQAILLDEQREYRHEPDVCIAADCAELTSLLSGVNFV